MLLLSLAATIATAAGSPLRGLTKSGYTADAKCQQHPHLINSLPDTEFSSLPFCMYSGNIGLPSSGGDKSIFYWLVESERGNATDKSGDNDDPLVLWFNGGPSCSSLIGLFHELGPFYPTEQHTLARNANGWNRNANVLFVDSPAGVGFSTSKPGSTGDDQTAQEALEFLQGFLAEHPEYSGRPVWLAGESYAGHYVPNLATAIVNANRELSTRRLRKSNQEINLQGFLVGNPATDDSWEFDGGSKYTGLFNANFLSAPTYLDLQSKCKNMNPFGDKASDMSAECRTAMAAAEQESGSSYYNSYSIYADTCSSTGDRHLTAAHALQRHRGLATEPIQPSNAPKHGGLAHPCIGDFTETYLRRADVIAAIHAPTKTQWSECSGTQQYGYTKSVLDKYHQIIADDRASKVAGNSGSALRMLVFSGDGDSVVATVGTRAWIDSLKLTETSAWRPWVDSGNQLGGFTQQYEDGLLTFATVRDAGHEVPQYQPERGLRLFESFISTGNMPVNSK